MHFISLPCTEINCPTKAKSCLGVTRERLINYIGELRGGEAENVLILRAAPFTNRFFTLSHSPSFDWSKFYDWDVLIIDCEIIVNYPDIIMIQINLLLPIATRRVSFLLFSILSLNRLTLQGKLTLRRYAWSAFDLWHLQLPCGVMQEKLLSTFFDQKYLKFQTWKIFGFNRICHKSIKSH